MRRGTVVSSIIAVLSLGAVACLHGEEDQQFRLSWASADSVAVQSVSSTAVEFTVFGTKPTPCHVVVEPLIITDNARRRVSVKMRSQIDQSVICAQVITAYQRAVTVVVSGPGSWEFSFGGGSDGDSVITVVSVP